MKNALAGVERALFWTLAFAAFAATAAGLAARAVDRVAEHYQASRDSYAIVRVIAPEGEAGLAAAQAALEHAPQVAQAAPMGSERAAALLSRWGGQPVRAQDLPALALIELELRPDAGPQADYDLEAALAQSGVSAQVLLAPEEVAGAGVASQVRNAALAGAVLFALVMALIISLAARGLAARRRELVVVMADSGATRAQAAGRVADEAAALGFWAGLTGALMAAAAALIVMLVAIPGLSADTLPAMILPIDLAPLVAAPLGAALAAGAGARAGAAYFHAQAARLG